MSALRLVIPGPSTPPPEGGALKRLRGRPAAIRRPLLITSLEAAVEFQEWCETVAVANDRCQVRMDRALPRGTPLRLDIPNMRVQETRMAGGECLCQWESSPRSLLARVAGSVAIHGPARYWVTEIQFQVRSAGEPAGSAPQAPAVTV